MALKNFRRADYQKALRRLVPLAPMSAAEAILNQAQARHLRHVPPAIAIWQAAVSHIRHAETDYDALLLEGYDRDAARFFVLEGINETLARWGSSRFLDAENKESFD